MKLKKLICLSLSAGLLFSGISIAFAAENSLRKLNNTTNAEEPFATMPRKLDDSGLGLAATNPDDYKLIELVRVDDQIHLKLDDTNVLEFKKNNPHEFETKSHYNLDMLELLDRVATANSDLDYSIAFDYGNVKLVKYKYKDGSTDIVSTSTSDDGIKGQDAVFMNAEGVIQRSATVSANHLAISDKQGLLIFSMTKEKNPDGIYAYTISFRDKEIMNEMVKSLALLSTSKNS